jgi:predicted amidohydrolase YtcJ
MQRKKKVNVSLLLALVVGLISGCATRTPVSGEEAADMIASVTYNAAYANFLEKETGSIEVGKSADFVVIDRNLIDMPVTDIHKTQVLMTFFKGKEIYRSK